MMVSRRSFLQGLSLGALSPMVLPFMHYVSANDSVPLATRVVLVVEGNGIEPVNLLSPTARADIDSWSGKDPIGGRRNFEKHYSHAAARSIEDATLAQARSLEALAEHDLDRDAAVLLGLSNAIAGGGHSSGYGALACLKANGVPQTPTIDCHLSGLDAVRGIDEGGRGRAPFEALRYGIAGNADQFVYGLSAYGLGKAAPVLTDPAMAYQQLFGPVATGETKRRFDARDKMIAFAHRDVQRVLKTMPSGSQEHQRLTFYLNALESLSESYALLGTERWRATLDAIVPDYGPGDTPPMGQPSFASTVPLDRLALQFEMATAALIGGLTNVAVLSCGAAGDWNINHTSLELPDLDDVPSRHPALHSAVGGGIDNPWAEYPRQVTKRLVDLIAKMASTLKGIDEGDGTMLDRTVIVYLSNNGASHHSSGKEWPVLLLGGRALGFQTDGRTVVYPQHGSTGSRNISNLFNTLSHAAGVELNDFGSESQAQRPQAGELTDLWAPRHT